MMELSLDDFAKKEEEDLLERDFMNIELCGKGAFGTVIKALDKSTLDEVAIKIIPKHSGNNARIIKEISIINSLDHPNIVKYYRYFETGKNFYLVMEYLEGGTLKEFINMNKERLNEDIARTIIKQVLNAVVYLHYNCDICHRDIKPDNIMLQRKDDVSVVKLLDFGLSSDYFEHKSLLENCGTLIYMAPEQINNSTYSKCVDMWSIGIILYILLCKGKHPFYNIGDSTKEIINKINEARVVFDDSCNLSKMSKIFIQGMLIKNPSYRYTGKIAIEHPWISLEKYKNIPLNFYDKMKKKEFKEKLIIMLLASIFLNDYSKSLEPSKKNPKKQFDFSKYSEMVQESNTKYEEIFRKKRDLMFLPEVKTSIQQKTKVIKNKIMIESKDKENSTPTKMINKKKTFANVKFVPFDTKKVLYFNYNTNTVGNSQSRDSSKHMSNSQSRPVSRKNSKQWGVVLQRPPMKRFTLKKVTPRPSFSSNILSKLKTKPKTSDKLPKLSHQLQKEKETL